MNLTKEIAKKYPLVWEEIIKKLNHRSIHPHSDGHDFIFMTDGNYHIETYNYYSRDEIKWTLPFNWLYATLEDFFEKEHGIDINTSSKYINEWGKFAYGYNIKYIHNNCIKDIHKKWDNWTKNEAKEKALLKACEILEERLNR